MALPAVEKIRFYPRQQRGTLQGPRALGHYPDRSARRRFAGVVARGGQPGQRDG